MTQTPLAPVAPREPECLAGPLFEVPGSETPTAGSGRRRRLAAILVALAGVVGALVVVATTGADANSNAAIGSAVLSDGVVVVRSDGSTNANGSVPFASRANSSSVGVASRPAGDGYWVVTASGQVSAYGAADTYGDLSGVPLNQPVVGMSSTPSGRGYWLVASDGGLFAFGDAGFYGSTGALTLNKPVVGMSSTPSGGGYWLVASDGGVFAFGDADFYGSAGALPLNEPVVGMAATPSGRGYWLVASDGGVFTYGDGEFLGSAAGGGDRVVDIDAVGGGYLLTAADGGTVRFDASGVSRTPGQDSGGTDSAPRDNGRSDDGGSDRGRSGSGRSDDGRTRGSDGRRPIAGFPNASTTGVTAPGALSGSGSVTVTQNGAVVENLDVNGAIIVRADNVVIRNVRVRGSASHLIRNHGRNLLVVDTTLEGQRPCAAGIAFTNYTARRVDVSGCADGLKANSNVVIEDSFIHGLRKWSGTHNDGIQGTGGSNIVIRNNTVQGPERQSVSAIKVDSFNRHLDDVVIEGNLLSGGGYTVYVTKKGGMKAPTNVRVVDNVFVAGSMTWDWRTIDRSPSQVWSGNRWDDGRALGG